MLLEAGRYVEHGEQDVAHAVIILQGVDDVTVA